MMVILTRVVVELTLAKDKFQVLIVRPDDVLATWSMSNACKLDVRPHFEALGWRCRAVPGVAKVVVHMHFFFFFFSNSDKNTVCASLETTSWQMYYQLSSQLCTSFKKQKVNLFPYHFDRKMDKQMHFIFLNFNFNMTKHSNLVLRDNENEPQQRNPHPKHSNAALDRCRRRRNHQRSHRPPNELEQGRTTILQSFPCKRPPHTRAHAVICGGI